MADYEVRAAVASRDWDGALALKMDGAAASDEPAAEHGRVPGGGGHGAPRQSDRPGFACSWRADFAALTLRRIEFAPVHRHRDSR